MDLQTVCACQAPPFPQQSVAVIALVLGKSLYRLSSFVLSRMLGWLEKRNLWGCVDQAGPGSRQSDCRKERCCFSKDHGSPLLRGGCAERSGCTCTMRA